MKLIPNLHLMRHKHVLPFIFIHLFFFCYRSEVADDLEVSLERSKFKNFHLKLVSKNASDSFSVVPQDRPENCEEEKLNLKIFDW